MGNLKEKFGYTEKSARWVCLYVLDKDLIGTFGKKYPLSLHVAPKSPSSHRGLSDRVTQ